jgi:hypothetical protein
MKSKKFLIIIRGGGTSAQNGYPVNFDPVFHF